MIPITENTIKAVAALIYNHAYDQDPDSGWLAGDESSGPAFFHEWLEWASRLVQTIVDHPEYSDEQAISSAKGLVDTSKVGHAWNTIWMNQTEEGDEYSSMTEETDAVMPFIRQFLENPHAYMEIAFIEKDPDFLAWMEEPSHE